MEVIGPHRRDLLPTSGPVRAAEYVRMSTDGQQYSIPRQQAAIRAYAQERGLTIVRTYADPGRSGLLLKNRPGLIQLLDDVQRGTPDYDVILVYDVSRWGRFQDTDESGFYEYMCRRAGVRVEYCVELFENDGGPLAAILKNIKRIMAAEYSREQSARVHRAVCGAVARGFFGGGSPNYGLRRVLVGPNDEWKGILEEGQRRALRCDHMVLTLGPKREVATVRRIFRLFVDEGLTRPQIASKLNREGKVNRIGRRWRRENINTILTCERYTGTLTYNRWSRKNLNTRARKRNEQDKVIRTPNAIPPIITRETFDAAKRIIAIREHRSYRREYLLDHLRDLLRMNGRLTQDIIRANSPPDPEAYARHFRSLHTAYALIGYEPKAKPPDFGRLRQCWVVTEFAMNELADAIRLAGANVTRRPFGGDLVINGGVTLDVIPARHMVTRTKRLHRWVVTLSRYMPPTLTIVARIDEGDEEALDYFVLSVGQYRRTRWRLRPEGPSQFPGVYCASFAELMARVLNEIGRTGEPASSNI